MKQQIENYIKAGYSGIYLVSHEEQRIEAELKAIAQTLKYKLYAWSITDGLVDPGKGAVTDCHDPVDTLAAIADLPEKSIVLLRDYHLFFEDSNPVLLRTFKDELRTARTKAKTLIVLGCRLSLPVELEREFAVIDFALPGEEALTLTLQGIAQSANVKLPKELQPLLDAAKGLTTLEAANAFALSLVQMGKLDAAVVSTMKAQTIQKGGLLEILAATESVDSIGGLDLLKDWLVKRKQAFSKRAQAYGLPHPKATASLSAFPVPENP